MALFHYFHLNVQVHVSIAAAIHERIYICTYLIYIYIHRWPDYWHADYWHADNWHAENWHGGQLALTFLIVSYLITLMF